MFPRVSKVLYNCALDLVKGPSGCQSGQTWACLWSMYAPAGTHSSEGGIRWPVCETVLEERKHFTLDHVKKPSRDSPASQREEIETPECKGSPCLGNIQQMPFSLRLVGKVRYQYNIG